MIRNFNQVNNKVDDAEDINALTAIWMGSLMSFNETFKDLMDSYAEDIIKKYCEKNSTNYQAKDIKFVVLIDDLDKCSAENIVCILEKIHKYLRLNNCVFVLAINYRIVSDAICTKYKYSHLDGQQYLEKILNYSFYLPEPKSEKLTYFIKEKLEKPFLSINQNKTTSKPNNSYNKSKFEEAIYMFSYTTVKCGFNNLRRIKYVFNKYIFFLERNLEDVENSKFNLENIIKLIILAEYYPNIFHLLLDVSGSISQDLNQLGNNSFRVKDFEEKFGISISNIYPQMIKMKHLFSLISSTNSSKYSLVEEVRHVCQMVIL